MIVLRVLSIFCVVFTFSGCVSVPEKSDDNTSVGFFLDAGAVQGLAYSTPSQSGITGVDGSFDYLAGEDISFSLGGTLLASVPAQHFITTRDLFRGSINAKKKVENLSRLLQSLDFDGKKPNGIVLHSDINKVGVDDFDTSSKDFWESGALDSLLMLSGLSHADLSSEKSVAYSLAKSIRSLEDGVPFVTAYELIRKRNKVKALHVYFSQDMSGKYHTTGQYNPSKSYWSNPYKFVVKFKSVSSNGMIHLLSKLPSGKTGFVASNGGLLENKFTIPFYQFDEDGVLK